MDYKSKALKLINEMSLKEKTKFVTGKDFWTIEGLERLNVKEVIMTDGPHGLRKVNGDFTKPGISNSYKATCFPPACLTACSFNEELLFKMGEALAEECLENDVSMILGPGVNHKRSPLCGRNFEYFSEDPLLSGKLAASYIKGVQSKNIGTSLKHFAANSQEKCRLVNDSIIDERALHEIYLKQFEIAIKEAKPYSIMAAYNKLNGEYCCQNKYLLTNLAREKWGFDGFFVSDWGAMSDPLSSYVSGLNLEMPGISKGSNKILIEAVNNKIINEDDVNKMILPLIIHSLRYQDVKKQNYKFDIDKHLNLAREIAEDSFVLLKNNNNVLPLKKEEKLLIVGDFAKNPRYQGAGSSLINPLYLDNAYQYLNKNYNIDFAQGYNKEEIEVNESLIEEAKEKALNADKIVAFIGLPDAYESEGYDRDDICLPESHLKLIDELSSLNKKIVVILQCGSVVALPFIDKVDAIILMYLAGSKNGEAIYNVLSGKVSPSGRLAETFIKNLKDTPCYNYYLKNDQRSLYKESIYTGYRYYNSANVEVNYPFGYGLSYTIFKYLNFNVSNDDKNIFIDVTLKNIGDYDAKEVIQIYIGMNNSKIYRAKKELKAFKKVHLKVNEVKKVNIQIPISELCFYNSDVHDYTLENGNYQIYLCKDVNTVIDQKEININFKNENIFSLKDKLPSYYDACKIQNISDDEFEKLLNRELEFDNKIKPFTIDSRIKDIKNNSFIGKIVINIMAKKILKGLPLAKEGKDVAKMLDASLYDMPIRSAGMGEPFTKDNIYGFVDVFNLHLVKGLKKILK